MFWCGRGNGRRADIGGGHGHVALRSTSGCAAAWRAARGAGVAATVAIAVTALAPSASAATVTPVEGQVLINQGEGYRLATGPTEAAPGSSVVANPGGSAQIVYPDGCTVNVEPGAVVAITQESPCATTSALPPPVDGTTIAIGAAVVGAGAIAAILLSQGGDKDKPASP
jgi:hypothetical protein